MKLTNESLKRSGGFTGGPVRKEITFVGITNPDEVEAGAEPVYGDVTVEVYGRPLSYHNAVKELSHWNDGIDLTAVRISMCICDESGNPVFRPSDITGLDDKGTPILEKDPETGEMVERGALNKSLTDALLAFVGDISGLGKIKRS